MDTMQYILENFAPGSDEHMILHKAKNEFLDQKIKQTMNMAFHLKKLSPLYSAIYDEQEKLKEKTAEKYGTLWLWLTVSPHEDIEFDDFKLKIEKFAERKMFKDYLYVFEQRGKTKEEAGKGFHAHLLLKRNLEYKPSKII